MSSAVFPNPVLEDPQTVHVFATGTWGGSKNVDCLIGNSEGAKTWSSYGSPMTRLGNTGLMCSCGLTQDCFRNRTLKAEGNQEKMSGLRRGV